MLAMGRVNLVHSYFEHKLATELLTAKAATTTVDGSSPWVGLRSSVRSVGVEYRLGAFA